MRFLTKTDMSLDEMLGILRGEITLHGTIEECQQKLIEIADYLDKTVSDYAIASALHANMDADFDRVRAENFDLTEKLETMRAERDAAVEDLAVEKDCRFCKFYDKSIRVGMYCGREDCDYGESDKWEWRGANV